MAKYKDINDVTDDISMILREIVEAAESNMITETAVTMNTDLEGVNNAKDYLNKQAAKNRAYQKRLMDLAKQSEQQQINIARNIGTYAGINTSPLEEEIKKGSKILLQSAQAEKNKQVQKVYQLNKFNTSAQFVPDLKASIIKQTELGIESGIPVTYKNGRKVGYREYMEMAVRTGIQQEIGQQQIEIAKDANIVFFLCDEFADCADDHADYQGKIYYNADYESFRLTDEAKDLIAQAVRSKQMLSVQEVREGQPYLTTRPNCRHRLIPISIDEGIGNDSLAAVKQNRDSVRGSYRPENYDALKQQRALERNIRKNKKALETFELLKKRTNSNDYDNMIRKRRLAISNSQANLRKLLEQNPNLSRERRRETAKILIKDVGVKYNLKDLKGKPPTPVNDPTPPTPPTEPQPVQMNETVKEHYTVPEEKKVYIKQEYKRKWEDKPDLWNNAKSKYNYDETYNKWVAHLKSKDDQYNDDQKYTIRDKVSYLYKSTGKHFSGVGIKFGEGLYSFGANQVEFRAIGETSESEIRTIEIATHEFGHAFDYNIGMKIFPKLEGTFAKIPTQLSAGRKAIDFLIRRFKNDRTLPAAVKQEYIENKIKKPFFDAIERMTPEQREVFEAGDQFSQSVQNTIKQNKPSKLLETEVYKKVKEFDNASEKIKEQVIDDQGLRPLYDKVGAYKKYEAGQRNLRLRFGMTDTEKESYEAACKLLGKDPTEILDYNGINDLDKEKEPIQEEWNMQWAFQQKRVKEKKDEYEKENMHITQMSDFLDALSFGSLRDFGKVRYGHGTKYYKTNTGDSEVEIFTHLQTLNMMNPDDYNLVKKEFPEICEAFENVISKSVDFLIKTEGVGGNE